MVSRLHPNISFAIIFVVFNLLMGCSSTKKAEPVPQKFQLFESLTNNPLNSKSLSLVRVAHYDQSSNNEVRSVFFDSKEQQYTILIQIDDVSRIDSPYQLIQLDSQGNVIGTYLSKEEQKISSLYWSHNHMDLIDGSVFFGTHFVDVFRKNEVSATAYDRELDIKTLSIDEFETLYHQAELVYYGHINYDFESEELDYLFNTYMQIDGKWLKLTANVLTQEDSPSPFKRGKRQKMTSANATSSEHSAADLFYAVSRNTKANGVHYALVSPRTFPMKLRKELIALNPAAPSSNNPIRQKYRAKEKYVSCDFANAFLPTGGSCKQGWSGAHYYELRVHESVFQFRSYGNAKAYQPTDDVKVGLEETASPMIIIQLYSGIEDNGLYLVTAKKQQ